jgi:adenylate kinase
MTTVEYMYLLVKQYGLDIPKEEMDKAINFESMRMDIAYNNATVEAHDRLRKML